MVFVELGANTEDSVWTRYLKTFGGNWSHEVVKHLFVVLV